MEEQKIRKRGRPKGSKNKPKIEIVERKNENNENMYDLKVVSRKRKKINGRPGLTNDADKRSLVIDVLDKLVKGHAVETSCAACGIHITTFYAHLDRDDALKRRYECIRLTLENNCIDKILNSNDHKAAEWFLERRYSASYGKHKPYEVALRRLSPDFKSFIKDKSNSPEAREIRIQEEYVEGNISSVQAEILLKIFGPRVKNTVSISALGDFSAIPSNGRANLDQLSLGLSDT